jgi:GntR family transcriptional repressor for pyruvate dehydrogenase complex
VSRIKRVSVCDSVVEHIMTEILEGRLRPGDRLPSEQKLAALLGVSRGTLREALKNLQLMGLVSVRQGEGTFVTKFSSEKIFRPLSSILSLDNNGVLEVIEARKILESELVRLCCFRAVDDEVEELHRLLNEMEEYCADTELDGFNEKDIQFHLTIARMAKNRVLLRILETVQDLLYEQIKEVTRDPEATGRACYYHRKILGAIKDRDDKLARKHMLNHLRNVEDTLVKMYSDAVNSSERC